MEKKHFIDLLKNPSQIQQENTAELKLMIEKFPYFQSARALYLKGLHNQDSFKYNNTLKTTAAYTTDRTVLFEFITSKEFKFVKEAAQPAILQETTPTKATKIPLQETIVPKSEKSTETEKIEKALEIGKPIPFSIAENHSFNQWLQLSVKKPIERKITEKSRVQQPTNSQAIIEKFIKNNPKIKPLSKDKNVAISVTKNKQDSSLMTETLAKVYLEQKKYDNAKQAYRILSLKYPEKSGFFADQIKRIQILQKNKS